MHLLVVDEVRCGLSAEEARPPPRRMVNIWAWAVSGLWSCGLLCKAQPERAGAVSFLHAGAGDAPYRALHETHTSDKSLLISWKSSEEDVSIDACAVDTRRLSHCRACKPCAHLVIRKTSTPWVMYYKYGVLWRAGHTLQSIHTYSVCMCFVRTYIHHIYELHS